MKAIGIAASAQAALKEAIADFGRAFDDFVRPAEVCKATLARIIEVEVTDGEFARTAAAQFRAAAREVRGRTEMRTVSDGLLRLERSFLRLAVGKQR